MDELPPDDHDPLPDDQVRLPLPEVPERIRDDEEPELFEPEPMPLDDRRLFGLDELSDPEFHELDHDPPDMELLDPDQFDQPLMDPLAGVPGIGSWCQLFDQEPMLVHGTPLCIESQSLPEPPFHEDMRATDAEAPEWVADVVGLMVVTAMGAATMVAASTPAAILVARFHVCGCVKTGATCCVATSGNWRTVMAARRSRPLVSAVAGTKNGSSAARRFGLSALFASARHRAQSAMWACSAAFSWSVIPVPRFR